MSEDYLLWKWKQPPTISRGLCALLVWGGAEVPEVELLDTERYQLVLDSAFPGWTEGGASFMCQVLPTGLSLQTYASTGDEVFRWFLDLARSEGLEFFDPQREDITTGDQRAYEARLRAVARAEVTRRRQAELADLRRRCDAGDPKALVELGNRYNSGDGVRKDLAQSLALYQRAAALGSFDGMFNVAACFRLGEGVSPDLGRAAEWYERALEGDKIFAAYALGELYGNPELAVYDKVKAVACLEIAREHGHPDALRELRRLGAL